MQKTSDQNNNLNPIAPPTNPTIIFEIEKEVLALDVAVAENAERVGVGFDAASGFVAPGELVLAEPVEGRVEGETIGIPFFIGGIDVLFVVKT